MKSIKNGIRFSGLLLLALLFASCNSQKTIEESDLSAVEKGPVEEQKTMSSNELPVQYQSPSYMVDMDSIEEISDDVEESVLKVGASIVSTRGPEPLDDILRILARAKGFGISWASDVNRDVLVDVDINANDDYHGAIENLLRQVDYFHEFKNNTLIIKYKETRQFHIAMPFTKQEYTTETGGNVLGGNDASKNVDGTIELKSVGNKFDVWANIRKNMDKIIATWQTTTDPGKIEEDTDAENETEKAEAARQVSSGKTMYIIDEPVGLITVTAPRPLLERLENYFNSLKKSLYKQIAIEAKIIEVQLKKNSSIGINWSKVLEDFQLSGTIDFGDAFNQVWPHSRGNTFVRSISLGLAPFDVFINALEKEGDTHILSSPKLSVMNGQPALISVGRNTTYIDDITVDVKDGVYTYSAETERILSGVGLALTANVLNDKEVIMNLVPVTSQLEEDIEYKSIGLGEVGLPIVRVREMSTTVKVRDGEMLVIGGLIDNTTDTTGEFAPVLGQVPLVRYLFGHEDKVNEKRELIILLKPTIL